MVYHERTRGWGLDQRPRAARACGWTGRSRRAWRCARGCWARTAPSARSSSEYPLGGGYPPYAGLVVRLRRAGRARRVRIDRRLVWLTYENALRLDLGLPRRPVRREPFGAVRRRAPRAGHDHRARWPPRVVALAQALTAHARGAIQHSFTWRRYRAGQPLARKDSMRIAPFARPWRSPRSSQAAAGTTARFPCRPQRSRSKSCNRRRVLQGLHRPAAPGDRRHRGRRQAYVAASADDRARRADGRARSLAGGAELLRLGLRPAAARRTRRSPTSPAVQLQRRRGRDGGVATGSAFRAS